MVHQVDLAKKSEVEKLAELVPAGTKVCLSTLPHLSLDHQIETARIVRVNGFTPVRNVAARYFASQTELVGYLVRAKPEIWSENMLIIGGAAHQPKGEFGSSLSVFVPSPSWPKLFQPQQLTEPSSRIAHV